MARGSLESEFRLLHWAKASHRIHDRFAREEAVKRQHASIHETGDHMWFAPASKCGSKFLRYLGRCLFNKTGKGNFIDPGFLIEFRIRYSRTESADIYSFLLVLMP